MKSPILTATVFAALVAQAAPGMALSLSPEEFHASRQMACVLAQQELGQLSEEEYGSKTHRVLAGFGETERDAVLAKALGYFDGLMFAITDDNEQAVARRLEDFTTSNTCSRHKPGTITL